MNDEVKTLKNKNLKDFKYLVFEGLNSCSEYTFQIDLIWIPNSLEEVLLATAEGGPFQTKPSANSSTLNLSTTFIGSDSIHFKITCNIPK